MCEDDVHLIIWVLMQSLAQKVGGFLYFIWLDFGDVMDYEDDTVF